MFTFVQISIIFSLYNSLEGKYIRTCMRLCWIFHSWSPLYQNKNFFNIQICQHRSI
jgi:hypothetical protein